jgi:hypothetical protein
MTLNERDWFAPELGGDDSTLTGEFQEQINEVQAHCRIIGLHLRSFIDDMRLDEGIVKDKRKEGIEQMALLIALNDEKGTERDKIEDKSRVEKATHLLTAIIDENSSLPQPAQFFTDTAPALGPAVAILDSAIAKGVTFASDFNRFVADTATNNRLNFTARSTGIRSMSEGISFGETFELNGTPQEKQDQKRVWVNTMTHLQGLYNLAHDKL